LAVLFVGSLALSDFEYQAAFTRFMQDQQRSYTTDEFQYRYKVFRTNYDFILDWNTQNNSFTVGVNQFADLSLTEFSSIYLGVRYDPAAPRRGDSFNYDPSLSFPLDDVVDWRSKGAVTGIKDQAQCGSCWSFSATGSTEAAHFFATGQLVSLSEQNLMDCSTPEGNQGCNGGLMDSAFDYIIKNKGIDTEASYPYTAKNGNCHFSTANVGATLTGYTDVPSQNEAALVQALQGRPVSVAIDASHSSFQFYKTGVYYEAACSATRLDHGVLAVGYGTDASGADYYIVKNSWGTSWGTAGYINMARNRSNNCGIASMASYPKA